MDAQTKLVLNKCAELCERVYSDELDYVFDTSIPGFQIFAVDFTLEKWTGQGKADQELLIALKPYLHGCVLEFMFDLEQ